MTRFGVVVADPPWRFGDSLTMSKIKRGAASHYDTMTTKEMCSLELQPLLHPDAILVLWTPGALLAEGLQVIQAWGFGHKGFIPWVKRNRSGILHFGLGHIFRGCCEEALWGTRGRLKPWLATNSERNLIEAPPLSHSSKPEELQDALDRMFPDLDKLELFARRERPGWTCLGNEVPSTTGKDIREALKELL